MELKHWNDVIGYKKYCHKCHAVTQIDLHMNGVQAYVKCKLCGHTGPIGKGVIEACNNWQIEANKKMYIDSQLWRAEPHWTGDEIREFMEELYTEYDEKLKKEEFHSSR